MSARAENFQGCRRPVRAIARHSKTHYKKPDDGSPVSFGWREWPARREIVVVVVTCVQRTESPRDKLKRLPFGTVNRTGGGKNYFVL